MRWSAGLLSHLERVQRLLTEVGNASLAARCFIKYGSRESLANRQRLATRTLNTGGGRFERFAEQRQRRRVKDVIRAQKW